MVARPRYPMPNITIRSATADDVPLILGFIKALARFENEPDAVKTTPEDLLRDGFGERPRFEVLIAERDDKPVGFALFFMTYSTWEGRPSLYLEDLFVVESARKYGVGRALMAKTGRSFSRMRLSAPGASGSGLEPRPRVLPSSGHGPYAGMAALPAQRSSAARTGG